MDNSRLIAHSVVISCALSPCGEVIIFGTTTRCILVYSVPSIFRALKRNFEVQPHNVLKLEKLKTWHSLCTTKTRLLCGSGELIWTFRWINNGIIGIEETNLNRLPVTEQIRDREITCLQYCPIRHFVFAGTSGGTGHIFCFQNGLVYLKTIVAHESLIHAVCPAGPDQIGSCSEDGVVSFWDSRCMTTSRRNNAKPVQSFYPYQVETLARHNLGKWLTALASETQDNDWFAVGGGPRFAIWNRRAEGHLTKLRPDGSSAWADDIWYAQTCLFYSPSSASEACTTEGDQLDPTSIIAGGNSKCVFSWDYGGHLLASLPLGTPAESRINHAMLVVGPLSAPKRGWGRDQGGGKQIMLVAGAGPVIRVISPTLGYSLGTLRLTCS